MKNGETKRAAVILPQSAGSGLGQQTGGNERSDAREAVRLLEMIDTVDWDARTDVLSWENRLFLSVQMARWRDCPSQYTVTGKQLFYLRSLKDGLVERGVL